MDASVTPQQTPPVVEELMAQLQKDCGGSATVTLKSEGYSHGRTASKFNIVLVSKQQVLTSLFSAYKTNIIDVKSKRSGAMVRTTIFVKVAHENASLHPQTAMN